MQRFVSGQVEQLGEREIGVICSTDQLARDGHVLEPSGIKLDNYKRNPIVLFEHDSQTPVGVCTAIGLEGRALAARIEFAPAGISARADEIAALAKAGVIRGVSIGFDPIDAEPLDPRKPYGGLHITTADLLEVSLVNVPADTGAMVVARSFKSVPGALAMLRSLPRVSARAVDNVTAKFGRIEAPRPLYDCEAVQRYRQERAQHATTVSAIGIARDVEQRERRQRESEELQAIGESYAARHH
jgi:HK97 family phage prohead protease